VTVCFGLLVGATVSVDWAYTGPMDRREDQRCATTSALTRIAGGARLNVHWPRFPPGTELELSLQRLMVRMELLRTSTVSRALLMNELTLVEATRIPGAVLRSGTLKVPVDNCAAANAEMRRIGSPVRFGPMTKSLP
jgi:hypothetical protein